MTKILHLSNDFYPSVTGGTELFIKNLIDAQARLPGVSEVIWAAHGTHLATSGPSGPQQVGLGKITLSNRRESAKSRSKKIPGFADLLERFQPDLLHLHSLSPHCGLSHVEAARSAGVPAVITIHAPGNTCMQGSLLYHRREVCDGVMRAKRCTECRLVNGGLSKFAAKLVASQSGWPLSTEAGSRLAHVLTSRRLTTAFHSGFQSMAHMVQGIHVLAEWSRQMMMANGVPGEKVALIRTAGPAPLPQRRRRPMEDGTLRLVYWGRCSEIKGVHLIIDAIRSLPRNIQIELSFYGPYWDDTYGQMMKARIAGDHRFIQFGNLPQSELLPKLQEYDLAVIPSTCLETGPLTVLEAWAAGLPVAGSELGGIQEWLKEEPSSFLVPIESTRWRELLLKIYMNPSLVHQPDQKVRQFSELANDLNGFYGPLIAASLKA